MPAAPPRLPDPVRPRTAGGLLFAGPLLMILFREKYPRWWFDWNVALWKFENRIAAYMLLLRDEYPAADDEQAVRLDVEYPDVRRELNRWLPLVNSSPTGIPRSGSHREPSRSGNPFEELRPLLEMKVTEK